MIKYIFSIVILVLLVACETEEPQNEQFFDTEEENNDVASLKSISKRLEKEPNNIKLWIEKGELCKDNLDYDCALDAGAKAYRLDSSNIDARQLYAWTLINKPDAPISDIERAQKHYKYILSLSPNNPKTLVDLANTFALTGDMKTAIKYINDALRIDERYRDGYVLKGSIYKTLDKKKLALSSYQTAVQLDPDFFMGHLNTGWLLTDMEDHKLALEYYENATDLKPNNLNAIYGVAKSLQDLEKYDEALIHYRKLEKLKPAFHITYFNEGYIKHHYQKQLDSATFFYSKALDYNPEYVPAWYQIGKVYEAQGRKTEAANAYSEAVKIDKNFTPAIEAAEALNLFEQ
ncbi:hypothetical protein CW751_05075 [Brumimicrobium salinarum]|uniref:Cytochrome c-type biogenesis protein H TPR domain-containing protein n=1 Tax=Brumimicrobium salinarum TaxID=2058658 RepID=A0A2I0R4F7_9FLAO|nr:tetratricopeptide repeat protein [Brumimicrobium salinarum]PKR81429.1 hypothetical protein CW751_05075 [Brumimicrobium salinarum]